MTTWVNPYNAVSGAVVTAANLDTYYTDLTVVGEAWVAYTPAWTAVTTNPVLGNGTLTGRYRKTGFTVDVAIELLMGSTTTYGSGTYLFSMPATSRTYPLAYYPLGLALLRDDSANLQRNRVVGWSSTTVVFLSDQDGVGVTNLVPFTFAVTDRILLHFRYESAA